jgi:hypothetical protein
LERASAQRDLCRIQAGCHRGERVITLSRIFQLQFQRQFLHKTNSSTGPRSEERGSVSSLAISYSSQSCFNGATRFQSSKKRRCKHAWKSAN